MKLSDELIELFDNLSIENQTYALGILQSLRFAQDNTNKQPQSSNKGKRVSIKKGDNDPQ